VDIETVVLTETYASDDGHSDTLRWTIHMLGEGRYTGHEHRLEDDATGGQAVCAGSTRATRLRAMGSRAG